MDVRVLSDQDHEVLGLEYCSGYTDSFGKWNTGFYCPTVGNEPVYCCGTPTYKYCCTKKDEERSSSLDQTVVLGIALGALVLVVVLTLVSCLFCRRCLLARRRHPSLNGGPLYRIHCSSTTSGVANMYSFSGQNSTATTPIDGAEPQVLTDLDYRHSMITHSGNVPSFSGTTNESGLTRLGGLSCTAGRPHCHSHLTPEPPPPYHVHLDRDHRLCSGTTTPTTSSFSHSNATNPVRQLSSPDLAPSAQPDRMPSSNTRVQGPDGLYWSTKF